MPVNLEEIIGAACGKHSIPFELFASLIMRESEGILNAGRFEQSFYLKYVLPHHREGLIGHVPEHLPDIASEKIFRGISYGLTQIMGETAREMGFAGDRLFDLFEPDINVEFGGKFFARCMKLSHGDERGALLHWNGGDDEQYHDKVFAIRESGQYKELFR